MGVEDLEVEQGMQLGVEAEEATVLHSASFRARAVGRNQTGTRSPGAEDALDARSGARSS